jgi:hypothetical protein
LEVTQEEKRSVFISNYNILLALVAFVAPQFGAYLLEQTSIDMAMIVSTILRGSSAGVFFFLYLFLKKNQSKSLPAAFI